MYSHISLHICCYIDSLDGATRWIQAELHDPSGMSTKHFTCYSLVVCFHCSNYTLIIMIIATLCHVTKTCRDFWLKMVWILFQVYNLLKVISAQSVTLTPMDACLWERVHVTGTHLRTHSLHRPHLVVSSAEPACFSACPQWQWAPHWAAVDLWWF